MFGMSQKLQIFIKVLLLACVFLMQACNSFEYQPDQVAMQKNGIHVGNVGFKGFAINPPADYKLLAEGELAENPQAEQWVESFRIGYQNSEEIDYHFHQDFVFQREDQIIFFIPFQNKAIRQFRHTPPDILERYLIDWVRDAEFAKIIDYDLSWRTESDSRGHSTVVLKSKKPKAGIVYEEHVMTGDLNEMFIFAGFAPESEAAALTRDLNLFRQSLNVLR